MTTYFAGCEAEDFVVGGAVPSQDNNSWTSVAGNRASTTIIGAAEDVNYLESSAFSSNELWTRFGTMSSGWESTFNFAKWYAGGTHKLGLRWTNSATGAIEMRKWNGSAWVSLATATSSRLIPNTSSTIVFDIHIKLGNPGELRVYGNNNLYISQIALDLSGLGPIDKLRLQGSGTIGYTYYYSNVLVADYPTLFAKVIAKTPTGNGTYQEWTNGGFGVIDEIIPAADLATSPTVGQRTTYTHAAAFPALAANESIAAVKSACSIARDAAGPQNVNFMTRISTTDYNGSDQAINTTTTRLGNMWETSPATAVAWTVTELNAAQFGLRSRT